VLWLGGCGADKPQAQDSGRAKYEADKADCDSISDIDAEGCMRRDDLQAGDLIGISQSAASTTTC
jgi:hypothetical protein